ncbi:rhomboid family intramembrane serine protease [Mesonia sp. HuA40]|uniref:rhomboid family intramembrane serine protease n=1 Tax=Mesonia sp. HuA40 TaxID=2602761 RepID=UPI0011CB9AC8|nr:rhomboid family intramembrane serine protease [Mesonia sp. HuA40]TXK71109.1 rhomboid family intramembrane serine protease [Mesonia sp. HuA40]
MNSIELVTLLFIAINVIVSFKGFQDANFFNRYKFMIGPLQNGERIRFLSSGFLHVDPTHLLVNMLTLYFFANVVIYDLGVFAFIIIYLGSLIAGNLFSFIMHKNNSYYSAVGASGAVMGVLYSAILLRPDMMLGLFFIIPIPAYVFGIGYLLYTLYGMKAQNDLIGHDAHFGGAMAGYFISLVLAPSLLQTNLLMAILLLIPLILLFFLKRIGKL